MMLYKSTERALPNSKTTEIKPRSSYKSRPIKTPKSPQKNHHFSPKPDSLDEILIEDYRIVEIDKCIIGTVINHRYEVSEFIDSGSYGQVLKVVDLQDPFRPLVIKISTDQSIFEREFEAMNSI